MAEAGSQRPMAVEIDDPEDLENALIRALIRRAVQFRIGKQSFVIARGLLSRRWLEQTRRFASQKDAIEFINSAERGGLKAAAQRGLAMSIVKVPPTATANEVKQLLADHLWAGELWAIPRNARVEKGKADAAVYSAVNAQFGTSVDFVFLAQWEGGQYLHGYVPFANGAVAGGSGVTIATGFDIGQKSKAEIGALGFSADVATKISPFAALKLGGKTREQVIDTIAALKTPVPVITKPQADEIDRIIHAEHLSAAVGAWNGAKKFGVPSFAQMPSNWQTVIFSRFFHQGKGAHRTGVIKKFWTAATTGEWETAVAELEGYPVSAPWYKTRVRKEAAHLRGQSPPPVPKPAPRKPPTVSSPANTPQAVNRIRR